MVGEKGVGMQTSRYLKVMSVFGGRLRKAREAAGYSSAQRAAQVLGLEPHTYRKYERGDAECNFELLVRMAELFGVSVAYLLPTSADSHASPQPSVRK